MFNNKGGVGKTTLLCNIAARLRNDYNLSILLVDADPQCNATQLVLPGTKLDRLYNKRSPEKTILDLLRPIGRGDPTIALDLEPIPGDQHRFNFDLIPGHPSLALLEDKFSSAWLAFESGDIAGMRQTNWVSQLTTHLKKRYDIVFFDVGPSLGALNRTVLIGTDFFATPLSCDIFSIAGLENISAWFRQWMTRYTKGLESCQKQEWGGELTGYPYRTNINESARFVGYTVQQYITKIRQGERRPTSAYETIRRRIPKAISETVSRYTADNLAPTSLDLGDVPNMFSLVPLAQSANAPVFSLEAGDGLNGAQYSQRDTYADFLSSLSQALLTNLGYVTAQAKAKHD